MLRCSEGFYFGTFFHLNTQAMNYETFILTNFPFQVFVVGIYTFPILPSGTTAA